MRLIRGQHLRQTRIGIGIVGADTVGVSDYALFAKPCYVPARIVMCRIRYSETACNVNKAVSGERMPKGCMVVLALTDKIQFSVLTEAIASVCTERGRVSVFGVAESIRGRSAVAVVDRRHYLSADRGCKLVVAALRRFGIKAYLFVRQRIGIAARKRPEKFAAFNKSAYIVLARYF